MTIQTQNVQLGDRKIQVYRFDLTDANQKTLYESAKQQGLAKAPYTHTASAGNERRPLIVVQASQILGTLADAFTAQILREQLPTDIQVIRYDDIRTDDFRDTDQFDIKLTGVSDEKIVEVRSSVAKFLPSPARVIDQFRLLGWYSTANKPGESVRDYYFQPVFITLDKSLAAGENARTFKSMSPQYFEQGKIELYLLGAASRHDLETQGQETREAELLQSEAIYQTLRLNETRPITDVISEIRSDFRI